MKIQQLSNDILFAIFDELKQVEDLVVLSQTCKILNKVARIQELWHNRIIRDFDLTSYIFLKSLNLREHKLIELYRNLHNPQIFVWGEASNGRLGISKLDIITRGLFYLEVDNPFPLKSLTKFGISTVTCGGFMMLALSHSNKVYFCGAFKGDEKYPDIVVDEPMLLDVFPKSSVISQIACGRMHALALADDGKAFLLTNPKCNATQVKFFDGSSRIMQISCGSYSCLFLTSNHSVYLSKISEMLSKKYFFELIFNGLTYDECIVKVASGDNFALGLTNFNRVIKWLYNQGAQRQNARRFGTVDEVNDNTSETSEFYELSEQPIVSNIALELNLKREYIINGQIVEEVKDVKIINVTAQLSTFNLFDDSGRLWNGSYLYNGETGRFSLIRRSPKIEYETGNPIQISIGDLHYAILTDTGNIFTYGQHALGRGTKTARDQNKWESLGKVEYFDDLFVLHVACGGKQTVALAVDLNSTLVKKPSTVPLAETVVCKFQNLYSQFVKFIPC